MSGSIARTAAQLCAAAAFASFAGCATAPQPRVISFGDSLSDLGTYAARTEGRTGARFTTNPGPVWTELVARELGTTVSVHRHAGFGKPVQVLGGLAYAEGGARVKLQPGSGNTDAAQGTGSGQTALPVHGQVDAFLAAGRFGPADVVLVQAGANDIFRHLVFAPAPSQQAGEALMREAARDLAAEVARIQAAGARRIVVHNLQDWGEVPALGGHPRRGWASAWSRAFNEELARALQGRAVIVDVHALVRDVTAAPAKYGLQDASAPACRLDRLPGRSVLFCNADTLVAKDAHQTHFFADDVHPTTAGHRLLADATLRALREAR